MALETELLNVLPMTKLNNAFNPKEFLLYNGDLVPNPAIDKFKYLFGILYNRIDFYDPKPIEYNGNIHLNISVDVDTIEFASGIAIIFNIKKGDKVYLDGLGYTTILEITFPAFFMGTPVVSIILGFDYNSVFLDVPTSFYKTINHKIDPNPDMIYRLFGTGYLNIAQDLRNMVSPSFNKTPIGYYAPSVVFNYEISTGSEFKYSFQFEDNGSFTGGALGFYNSSYPSLAQVPFKIGDVINVKQDMYAWQYDDNFFFSGAVGFQGSGIHNFLPGQQVIVTGQETYQVYNGYQTVNTITVTNTNQLAIDMTWISGTPTEGGTIYGHPRPEYDGVATITEIYYDMTLGVVIVTDKPFTSSSTAIGGNITYADGRKLKLSDVYVEQICELICDEEGECYEYCKDVPYITQTSLSYFNFEMFDLYGSGAGNGESNDSTFWVTSDLFQYGGPTNYPSFLPSVWDSMGLTTNNIQGFPFQYQLDRDAVAYMLFKASIGMYNFNNNTDINPGEYILECVYRFGDSIGTSLGDYRIKINFTEATKAYYAQLGIEWLEQQSGLDLTDCAGYNILLVATQYDIDGETILDEINVTERQTIVLDTTCWQGYEGKSEIGKDTHYYIVFRDSMGSYINIPCFLKSYESTETSTETYYQNWRYVENAGNRKQGGIKLPPDGGGGKEPGGGEFGRGKGRPMGPGVAFKPVEGRTNMFKRSNNKIKLNTKYLTEDETRLIQDLVESPEVYVQKLTTLSVMGKTGEFEDVTGPLFYSCQLLSPPEFNNIKRSNGDLSQYTLDISMSIDNLRF